MDLNNRRNKIVNQKFECKQQHSEFKQTNKTWNVIKANRPQVPNKN